MSDLFDFDILKVASDAQRRATMPGQSAWVVANAGSVAIAESTTMAAEARKPAARTRVDRAGITRLVIPSLG